MVRRFLFKKRYLLELCQPKQMQNECPSSPGTCPLSPEPYVWIRSHPVFFWWVPEGSRMKFTHSSSFFPAQVWPQCTSDFRYEWAGTEICWTPDILVRNNPLYRSQAQSAHRVLNNHSGLSFATLCPRRILVAAGPLHILFFITVTCLLTMFLPSKTLFLPHLVMVSVSWTSLASPLALSGVALVSSSPTRTSLR